MHSEDKKVRNIKNFVAASIFVGSLLMFTIFYFFISAGYETLLIHNTKSTSKKMTRQIFSSIWQLMKQGWSQQQMDEFLRVSQLSLQETDYQVHIHYLKDLSPTNHQNTLTDHTKEVFHSGKEINVRLGDDIHYLYPLKIHTDCLSCHQSNKPGDVVGVIVGSQNISLEMAAAREKVWLFLLLISPLPFLGSFLVARRITRKIHHSLKSLHERIESVHKVGDLKLLEVEMSNLGFAEFNAFLEEIKHILQRLRETAIDKDILETEVKLLAALMITSNVANDWKAYIKGMVGEINKIVDVRFLFAIFQEPNKNYTLEVFWQKSPADSLKESFHQFIMSEALFHHINLHGVEIHHNILDRDIVSRPEMNEKEIELHTKVTFLNAPCMGDIVAAGINTSSVADQSRAIVLESFLSSLINVVGSIKAIYQYARQLEYLATRDPLTQFYNQRVFWELLHYEVDRARRHNYKFALLVIDIDNFKSVNDTFGHLFGDKFLQEFSLLLKSLQDQGDVVARYGGDEFVSFFPIAADEHVTVSEKIMQELKKFEVTAPNGSKVKITVSIGVAIFPDHAQSANELLLLADNMMYRAKSLGKERVCITREEDVATMFRSLGEKNILILKALQEDKLVPNFQPILNLKTHCIDGHEFLMRINLADHVLSADEFVDTATHLGVISKMEMVLMEKIFAKVRASEYNGYIFLNYSPKTFLLNEFIPQLIKLTAQYRINPAKVVFEITERDTVKNLNLLAQVVLDLRSKGFKFAIDDFGSGFSSFQYLRSFPIDFIKIEGEFVKGMISQETIYKAIVLSITTLAKELHILTIAEYVENEEILHAVEKAGVDYVQGYYIGKPSPVLNIASPYQ
jgi:diguanylate cyclase (GGDEF)-like protein